MDLGDKLNTSSIDGKAMDVEDNGVTQEGSERRDRPAGRPQSGNNVQSTGAVESGGHDQDDKESKRCGRGQVDLPIRSGPSPVDKLD